MRSYVQQQVRHCWLYVGLLTVVVLCVVLFRAYNATAETTAVNVLKLSQVRNDVEIKPGEAKTIQLTATNVTDVPMTVHAIANDFVAGDERGTPALILDDKSYAPTHSLKRFMQPIPDVTIPAKQAKTVAVTISVPENAQAGGYFGAVRLVPTTSTTGGQVNLNASIASLILLTVPGDTVEKLEMTDFSLQQNGKGATYFRTSQNITTTFRFENKGNIQVALLGKVLVKRGSDIVYETDFNNKLPRDVVLPNSARRWDVPLKDLGEFGRYTVTATLTYGTKNQTVEVSRVFWVVPTIVIIIAMTLVLLLAGLLVGLWFFIKRHRHRRAQRRRYAHRRHR